MGEVITNLKAKFSVDSQNVSKGLKPGEDALADLDRKVGKSIENLKGMLTPLALLGAAGGAFATLKKSIESIEGPGDRLTAVIGGMKESLFDAGRALATLNFTDFLSSLKEGYDRGVLFAQMLDELEDRSAYNDYRISQYKRESAELQEVLKDRTLDLSTRAEAAAKILEIEEKVKKRREEIAQEEFSMQKMLWEGRNKMETSEALALYEQIDAMAPELKERLQAVFTDAMAGSLGVKAAQYSVDIVTKGLYSYDKTLYQEVPQDVINSYGEFFKLVQDGERDVLIKLFNSYKGIEETSYRAQEEYNMVVGQTTRLLAQEEKAVNDLAEARAAAAAALLLEMKDANKVEGPLEFYLPDPKDITKDLMPMKTAVVAVKDDISETVFQIKSIIDDGLKSAMEGFAMWIGEFAVGAQDFDALGRLVGQSLGGMLIQLGKTTVQTGIGIEAIKKAFASLSGVGAIAVGLGLIAFGSAISASVRSIPGNSGYSSGGSSGSGSFVYDNRAISSSPMEVVVTGEFLLRNNVLVAAIEQEDQRKRAASGSGIQLGRRSR